MNVASRARLVKRMVHEYGVVCTWERHALIDNGIGTLVPDDSTVATLSARLLLLTQNSNPKQWISAPGGLSIDYSKYVMALPDVDVQKDDVITDNHGNQWKVGMPDVIDVKGVIIAKQAVITRVNA
jgi:hypothetical protein